MMGVAYLDGKTPSVLVVRGTYGLMKVDAWMLRQGKLQKVWRWTTNGPRSSITARASTASRWPTSTATAPTKS